MRRGSNEIIQSAKQSGRNRCSGGTVQHTSENPTIFVGCTSQRPEKKTDKTLRRDLKNRTISSEPAPVRYTEKIA